MALFSTDVEFIACSETAKKAIWIRRLYSELTRSPPSASILLYTDNQSAVQLIKSNWFHERTKHIDILYYYAWDTLAQGRITIEHISTHDIKADILKKALVRETHWKHLHRLSLF